MACTLFYWICKKCLSSGSPLPMRWNSGSFVFHSYFEVFTESSCISTAECPAPEAGRHFLHGGMSNTSMGEGQNVPALTGGFFYSQICNFQRRASFWVVLVTVYDLAPSPPSPSVRPWPETHKMTVKEIQLADERGGGGGGVAKSYNAKKAWSSINNSNLSDLVYEGR